MEVVDLQTESVTLALRETFRTAIRATDSIEALRVTVITDGGLAGVGFGTATPMITGDTVASMRTYIDEVARIALIGCTVDGRLLDHLADRAEQCPSGTAAVDLALRSLLSPCDTDAGVPAETNPSVRVRTSVTIAADDVAAMVTHALRRVDLGFTVVKLKLGLDPAGDAERLVAVTRAVDGRAEVWVDANQGWTAQEALSIIERASRSGCAPALLEQPVHSGALTELDTVARNVAMPVFADESARTLHDIDRLGELGTLAGINVKFMKFGGITAALRAVERCRAHGLAVLVGSMMEHPSSVAAAVRFAATLTEPTHDLDAAWWVDGQHDVRYEASYACL